MALFDPSKHILEYNDSTHEYAYFDAVSHRLEGTLPSVTTLLKQAFGDTDPSKPENRFKFELSGKVGSLAHALTDSALFGAPPPGIEDHYFQPSVPVKGLPAAINIYEDAKRASDAWVAGVRKLEQQGYKLVGYEVPVVGRIPGGQQFAGKVDLVMRRGDELLMDDFKSNKNSPFTPNSSSWQPKHPLQVGLYSMADYIDLQPERLGKADLRSKNMVPLINGRPGHILWYPGQKPSAKGQTYPLEAVIASIAEDPRQLAELRRGIQRIFSGTDVPMRDIQRIAGGAYNFEQIGSRFTGLSGDARPAHEVSGPMSERSKLPERLPDLSKLDPKKIMARKGKNVSSDAPIIIWDTETTGQGTKDQIIELSAIKVQNGKIIDTYHRFFKPTVPIDPNASRVHGIYADDLAGAEEFSAAHIHDFLRWGQKGRWGHQAIGLTYNGGILQKGDGGKTPLFDSRFMKQEAERLGFVGNPLDFGFLRWDRSFDPFGEVMGPEWAGPGKRRPGYYDPDPSRGQQTLPDAKLSTYAKYLKFDQRAHMALDDSVALASFMNEMLRGKLIDEKGRPIDPERVAEIFPEWAKSLPPELQDAVRRSPMGKLITEGMNVRSTASRKTPGTSSTEGRAINKLFERERWINQYVGAWRAMLSKAAKAYRHSQAYGKLKDDGEKKEIDDYINLHLKGYKAAELREALQNGLYERGEEAVRQYMRKMFLDTKDMVESKFDSFDDSPIANSMVMPHVDFNEGIRGNLQTRGGGSSRRNGGTGGSGSGSNSGSGSGADGNTGSGSGGGGGNGGTGSPSMNPEEPDDIWIQRAKALRDILKNRDAGAKNPDYSRFDQHRGLFGDTGQTYDLMFARLLGEQFTLDKDPHVRQATLSPEFSAAFRGSLDDIVRNLGSSGIGGNEEWSGRNWMTRVSRILETFIGSGQSSHIRQLLGGGGSDASMGLLAHLGFEMPYGKPQFSEDQYKAFRARYMPDQSSSTPNPEPPPYNGNAKRNTPPQPFVPNENSGSGSGSGGGSNTGSGGGSGNPPKPPHTPSPGGPEDPDGRAAANANRMLLQILDAGGGLTTASRFLSNPPGENASSARVNAYKRARAMRDEALKAESQGMALDVGGGKLSFFSPGQGGIDDKMVGEIRAALEKAGKSARELAQNFILGEIDSATEAVRSKAGLAPGSGRHANGMDQIIGPRLPNGALSPTYDNLGKSIQSIAQVSEAELLQKRMSSYKKYADLGITPDIAWTMSQADYNAEKLTMQQRAQRDEKRQRSGSQGTLQHVVEQATGSSSLMDFLGKRTLQTGIWATSGMAYYALADGIKHDWHSVKEIQRDQVALEQALGYSQPGAPRGFANKVSNNIMGLSSKYGFNPEHIMDIALSLQGSMSNTLATPEQRLQNTVDATKAVVLLSKVGHVELGQSMENLVAISNAYKSPDAKLAGVSVESVSSGKEMIQAVNGLTALSNKFSVNMEQTSTAMARMGEIFQAQQVDSATAAGWIGAVQQTTGESGLQITSKLERVFPMLEDPTTQAKIAEIMAPAGVLNYSDLQGRPDAKKIFDRIGMAYLRGKGEIKGDGPKLNDAQVGQFAYAIGGSRGAGEVIKMIETYALSLKMRQTYSQGANSDAAEERWSALSKTALERGKELSGAWLNLMRNIASSGVLQMFSALLGVMTQVANVGNKVFGVFNNVLGSMGNFGSAIKILIGALAGRAIVSRVLGSERAVKDLPVLGSFLGNTRSMKGEYYRDMNLSQLIKSWRNPGTAVLGEAGYNDRVEYALNRARSLNFDYKGQGVNTVSNREFFASGIVEVWKAAGAKILDVSKTLFSPVMWAVKSVSDVLKSFARTVGGIAQSLASSAMSSIAGSAAGQWVGRRRDWVGRQWASRSAAFENRFLDRHLAANDFSPSEFNAENRALMRSSLVDELGSEEAYTNTLGRARLSSVAGKVAGAGAGIALGVDFLYRANSQNSSGNLAAQKFAEKYGHTIGQSDAGKRLEAIDAALTDLQSRQHGWVGATQSIPIVGSFFADPAAQTGINLTPEQLSEANATRKGFGRFTGWVSDQWANIGTANHMRDNSSTARQLREYAQAESKKTESQMLAVAQAAESVHQTVLAPEDAAYVVQSYQKGALYGSPVYDLYSAGVKLGQQDIKGQTKTGVTGDDVERVLGQRIDSINTQLDTYDEMNKSGNAVNQDVIKLLQQQRQDFMQQLVEYKLARRAAAELLNAVKGSAVDQAMAQFTNAMDKWRSFGSKDTAEAMQAAADVMNMAFSVAQASQDQRVNAIQGLGSTAVTPIAQNQIAGQMMNASIGYYQLLQKNAPGSAQAYQAGLGMVQSWRSYQDTVHQNNMSMIEAQGNLAASKTLDPLEQIKARRKAAEDKIDEIRRYQNTTETFNTGNETLDKFLQELKDKATDPMKEASQAFKDAATTQGNAAASEVTSADTAVRAADSQMAATNQFGGYVNQFGGIITSLFGTPGSSGGVGGYPNPFDPNTTQSAANMPGGSVYSSQVPKQAGSGLTDNLKGDALSAKHAASSARLKSGGTVSQASSVPSVGAKTANGWASDVLNALGMPVTSENVRFLNAWAQAEGTKAGYNPLATTQGMAGATNFNKVGVKNYASYGDGIAATVKTLRNGNYGNILAALANGNDAMAAARAVAGSKWGTGSGVLKVLGAGGGKNAPKLGAGTVWGGATDGSGNPDIINAQAEAAALALQQAVVEAQQREAPWLRDAGAASKEKQVSAQIRAAKDMISTLKSNHGDPVEIANDQKQLNELYYEQAQQDIERYAEAWRVSNDDSNKYLTLKESADETLKKMKAYLAAGGKYSDAEYQKMTADRKDTLRDAALQKTEYGVSDLTYSFNMHETSWTNYINGLKKFRDSVDKSSRSGLELWQQINEQILNAVESVSLNANIPTDIKVPTLYEVRRFIGAGLNGQAYMGSSTPINVPTGGPVPGVSSPAMVAQSGQTVNISVNGADTAFVLQVMSQYLGPANMSRSTYTTTRRV